MPTDYLAISPSGDPRTIPTDQNGSPVALTYFYKNGESNAVPAGYYAEALIRPSGVIYGSSGREYGIPIRNIGQYREAVLCLDVHAMTRPDSNESLAVAIETSFDNGNHWHRIAGFQTVSTAGKSSQVMKIAPSGTAGKVIWDNLNATSIPSTAIIPSGYVEFDYFGDLMRTSSEFEDAGGTTASGIFSVYGAFKR